jgi:phenylacetate-coenzyme A ligase PaaK-like adenylate-forming protein
VQLVTMYSTVDRDVATLTLNRPHAQLRERATRDLRQQIKSYIGVAAAIVVCDPGTVERSIGKAKRVIDARG